MGAMTYWECVRDAWSDAAKFIQRRRLTVAIAFAILFACNAISLVLSGAQSPISPGGASRLLQLITTPVRLVVMIALPIQVMQYVMLGESESRARSVFGKEFWRYFGLTVAIGTGCIAVALVVIGGGFLLTHTFKVYLGGAVSQLFVLGMIALCFISFFGARFSLLFCHVAIGRTTRWRASWTDTSGRVWRIVVSHLLASVPIEVLLIVMFAVVRKSLGTMGERGLPYFIAAVLSLLTVAGMIVGSSCACWLYRRLARTLLESP
jgi:hypothetical protein